MTATLRARADELAADLCVKHGLDAHPAIRDTLLRFGAECLTAEPGADMIEAAGGESIDVSRYDDPSYGPRDVFRAMAAERAKSLEAK